MVGRHFCSLASVLDSARANKAALFVSAHADAWPRAEGDAQGHRLYAFGVPHPTPKPRASPNSVPADVIAGIDLSDEPSEVADIFEIIHLA